MYFAEQSQSGIPQIGLTAYFRKDYAKPAISERKNKANLVAGIREFGAPGLGMLASRFRGNDRQVVRAPTRQKHEKTNPIGPPLSGRPEHSGRISHE